MKIELDWTQIEAWYQALPEGTQYPYAEVAQRLTKDIEDPKVRRTEINRLREVIKQHFNRKPKGSGVSRKEELEANNGHLAQHCKEFGVPIDRATGYWSKGKYISVQVRVPKDTGPSYPDVFRDIVKEGYTVPFEQPDTKDVQPESLALIVSDMHVGLNPNPNRRALYPVEYNEAVFHSNLSKVFQAAKHNVDMYGPVELLTINDLGDGTDGYNRLTTRGGHQLEQNMGNVEQFDVFVRGKLRLIDNVVAAKLAKKVVVNNVTNDNHNGDFAAIANTALQMLIQQRYPEGQVEFRVMYQCMEHFIYGDHCFILTHGKDQEYQFKGLPLTLDMKAEKFIRAYIDRNRITSKYIHVYKGDLHQKAYSKCGTFDYWNFMSIAPPSQWICHNFPDSYSGFTLQRIPKWSNEIANLDYIVKFEPVKIDRPEYVY